MSIEQPEPYVIARLYGLFKIHKPDAPMRPIISASNCLGQRLMQWLLKKLSLITSSISSRKVKDSVSLFRTLNGSRLGIKSELHTSDFDSMYTNIDFIETKQIIRKYYHLIAYETAVPVDVFLDALSFFIEGDAYFVYGDLIFRQCKSLSMGNCLSGILAEIYVSHILNLVIDEMPPGSLDFIFVFMDDIICGVHEQFKKYLIDRIMFHSKINLKSTVNDASSSVSYLNMEIFKNSLNVIEIKWWQKPEYCYRILDYHSFHPFRMKINVMTEYIRNSLELTSPCHWNETVNVVKVILSNGDYPSRIIKQTVFRIRKELSKRSDEQASEQLSTQLVNEGVCNRRLNEEFSKKLSESKSGNSFVRFKSKGVFYNKYVSAPYNPNLFAKIRFLLRELRISNVTLAPRMIISNRSHVLANMKDKRRLSGIVNASFEIKCLDCKFSWKGKTDNLDVRRTADHFLNNKFSKPYAHARENPKHKLVVNKSSLIRFKNKRDLKLSAN